MSIGHFNNPLIEMHLHILLLRRNMLRRSIVMHPVKKHK